MEGLVYRGQCVKKRSIVFLNSLNCATNVRMASVEADCLKKKKCFQQDFMPISVYSHWDKCVNILLQDVQDKLNEILANVSIFRCQSTSFCHSLICRDDYNPFVGWLPEEYKYFNFRCKQWCEFGPGLVPVLAEVEMFICQV